MLIQKDLYKILETVKNYRNEWKGHPGITPRKQELKRRLLVLESDLDKVRGHISDKFSNVLLIYLENMKFTDKGIYKTRIKRITGARHPFETITVEIPHPMEENKLYLLHGNYKTPIKLLPFVQIMPSPKTKEIACYFYNRIEEKNTRFVSFHYDRDPEIKLPKEILNNALSMLENIENNKNKIM